MFTIKQGQIINKKHGRVCYDRTRSEVRITWLDFLKLNYPPFCVENEASSGDRVVISSHGRLHLRVSNKCLVSGGLLISNPFHAADALTTRRDVNRKFRIRVGSTADRNHKTLKSIVPVKLGK